MRLFPAIRTLQRFFCVVVSPGNSCGKHEPLNETFTEYSPAFATLLFNREGTPAGTGIGTMTFWNHMTFCASAVREFVAPSYRPERYYMRGPGPACARRVVPVMVEQRHGAH